MKPDHMTWVCIGLALGLAFLLAMFSAPHAVQRVRELQITFPAELPYGGA